MDGRSQNWFWHLTGADPSVRPLRRLLDEHIVLALVLQSKIFLQDIMSVVGIYRRQQVGGRAGYRLYIPYGAEQ